MRTRKPCYRKDDRAMRPIYGRAEKFRSIPGYAHGYFSRNCEWLLLLSMVWKCTRWPICWGQPEQRP